MEEPQVTVLVVGVVSISTICKAISLYNKMVAKIKDNKEKSRLTQRNVIFSNSDIDKIKFCKFKPATFDVYFKWYEFTKAEYDKADSLYENIQKILDDKNVDIDNTKPYLDKLKAAVDAFNKQADRIESIEKNEFNKFIKMREEADKEEYSTDVDKLKELYKKMNGMYIDADHYYYMNTDYDDAWEGIAFMHDAYTREEFNKDKEFAKKVNGFYGDVLDIIDEIYSICDIEESVKLIPDAKVQFTGNAPKEK